MIPYEPPPMYVDLNLAVAFFFTSYAAVLAGIVLLLGAANFIVRSVQARRSGTFDIERACEVLDRLLLRKLAPLVGLGILGQMTFDFTRLVIGVLYVVWGIACIASYVSQLASAWRSVPAKVIAHG